MNTDINTLTISDAKSSDYGEYTAKATNKFGVVQAAVTVSVKEEETVTEGEVTEEDTEVEEKPKPQFELGPEATTVTEGETIRLTCRVTGLS